MQQCTAASDLAVRKQHRIRRLQQVSQLLISEIIRYQREVRCIVICSESLCRRLHRSACDDQMELAAGKMIERFHREIESLVSADLTEAEENHPVFRDAECVQSLLSWKRRRQHAVIIAVRHQQRWL